MTLKEKKRFLVVALLLSYCSTLLSDTLIPASNENINYYGRFDFRDPEAPIFNWSGATIEANLPGPYIGIYLIDGNSDYNIEIDGEIDTIVRTDTTKKYIIKTDLSEEYHIVRIIQRSENHYNKAIFKGFYVADGKSIGPALRKPTRKIEFIGDSYTAAYGVESSSRDCDNEELRKFTNVNLSFATLAARAFHSQSIILGWSGAGMVRNYGDGNKRSKRPFPYYYDKTIGEADTNNIWNFSQWIPDLVVICLGTNDFSTSPQPDDSMFTGDYHKFIATILKNYPDVSILCLATDDNKLQSLVQKIVDEEKNLYNRNKIYFAKFPQVEKTSCHWHLSIEDNKKIAKVLIDTIMKKLEWDTSAISSVNNSHKKIPELIETKEVAPNGISFSPLYLVNLKGERLLNSDRNKISLENKIYFNKVHFVGNNTQKWEKIQINIR